VLNRSNGALEATVTVRNNGPASLGSHFFFAVSPTHRLRLAAISGTYQNLTYLNVTKQVLARLSRIGNRNAKLDKGESVSFAISIASLDRSPKVIVHLLSVVEDLPTVSVMPEIGSGYAGEQTISALFTRTGSTTEPLTVFFSLGGSAVAGINYAAPLANYVVIPAGSVSAPVSFPTKALAIVGYKTLLVTAGSPPLGDYVIGYPSQAILTIIYEEL